jgi:alpha-glucosidase (family GH31 glycosyl hydrolase)
MPAPAADTLPSVVNGNVRFQALASNLLRMEYSPKTNFVDDASVAVIGRTNWPGVALQSAEKEGWLSLSTGMLTVSYKPGSGPFSGENLRLAWHDDSGDHAWKPGDQDDKNLGGVPAEMGGRSTVAVTDPGPLSRNGYYHLDDSRTALFDPATDWVRPRPGQGSQDWYFLVYGHDYAGALSTLSKLIGPVPMLPRYVFGAWIGSRAGYAADQWKMIVEQYREEGLPMDMLVLDSCSMRKIIWNGYDWDYEQMPDPKEFLQWTKNHNVKVTMNEHYGSLDKVNDSNFDAIRQAMGLPEGTRSIDHNIADKKYADLFMNLLHKPALDLGLAFWWQDGAAHVPMEGLDPCLWTRHVEYQGSEKITGKRTTCFCRLGSGVGSHRYGVFFTGDLHGQWESLPVMVPATVRGGNQLMPYMNNLCGGVFITQLPLEFYQRSIQFGAFSPVFWFHGFWGVRMPWEYGPAGEETYRTFLGLRYALMPYIYSYSHVAHDTGLPLLRGMYLDYPDQDPAYASEQQFMFGRELLAAPVTHPGNGAPARREVFLPAGDDWFDYFTGDLYEGGRTIVHECPIERMPVFVKAGSIIPMAPKMGSTDEAPVDPLTLDVYAGRRAADFNLYEDDGLSLDYRQGAFARTKIVFAPASATGDYLLTIGPAQGEFNGQLKQRHYLVQVHGLFQPEAVLVNDTALPAVGLDRSALGWTWDARKRTTTIHLPNGCATDKPVVVALRGAATFSDALTLQKAMNLRTQVRQAKRLMKLKLSQLLGDLDIKKQPRVIRRTEEVERELTTLINHPRGIGQRPPDFGALRQRVVDALRDKPFEVDRKIPELDPVAIRATQQIENGMFTSALQGGAASEEHQILECLRGAEVPAWLLIPR